MCGSGKKTLAHFVYKDHRVEENFELKELFTLSKETTTLEVLKLILEKVTSRPCNTEDPYRLQIELSDALLGKKFLFALVNVWEENAQLWEILLSACQSGARGSKMIMTMRSSILASSMSNVAIHELQLLSDDDCWQIFAKYMFPYVDFDAHSDLKEIGREIVNECQGLPLAVKSIGGVLRPVTYRDNVRKTQAEWRKKWDENIWKLQFEENQRSKILPPLLPSYQSLSPELKRCLAVCRLFPKGYQFRESDGKTLIWLWMALGLLKPDDGKRMEDVGKAYLEALISKSFFQYSSGSKQEFKMHNFEHDFIGRISSEFHFACGDSIDFSTLGKVYHLSYEKEDVLRKLASLSETKSLLTLLALPLPSNSGGNNQVPLSSSSGGNNQVLEKSLLDDLFRQVGRCFKVLSLPKSAREIPNSIKTLKHLTYLDASHSQVKRLSDKICSLLNLQVLILSDCKELRELPSKLAELVNLLHLDIRGTSVEKMPPHMGKMKNLETLSDFILSKDGGWRIKELAGLQRLGGSLRIEGLENIVDINDAGAANLKDKKFLPELILIWKSDSGASHQEVLNVLRPHRNLERLTIEGYGGTQLPDWVEGFNVLSCLIIKGCPELVQRCQRGTGDDWSMIQHIPTIYIDDQLI